VTELDSKLIVYGIDEDSGDLVEIETVSLYSPDFADAAGKSGEVQYPAEIALHPNRKWLYVTNRGLGAIFQFDISGNSGNRQRSLFESEALNESTDYKIRYLWPIL